ncbi:hypothetical protein Nmel_002045 [Mimus melanotis]
MFKVNTDYESSLKFL